MAQIRVFFVDDEKLLLESLEVFFTSTEDFTVVGSATSGEEALERLEAAAPDLMLVDLNMAGMGGVRLISALRHRRPSLRILILSTYYDDRNVTDAIAEGADGYILKTLSSGEIIRAARIVANGSSVLDRKVMSVLHSRARSRAPAVPATALDRAFSGRYQSLSEHEKGVCALVQQGRSNREIAAILHISEGTVKNYLSGIYDLMNVRDRTALALALTKNGILT